MRLIPSRINKAWITTLADDDLIDIEARLRDRFEIIDQRHRRTLKGSYILLRGPEELVTAWDRWSRVNMATKARALVPRVHVKE